MPIPMRIDFVSDVVCPWCVVGLGSLEAALERIGDLIDVDFHVQPFELNPGMPTGGENIVEHLGRKYGSAPEALAGNRQLIHQRAAEVGFNMQTDDASRIYNTFAAHRLLHWAGTVDPQRQRALKHALLHAYFTEGRDPGDVETLVDAATAAELAADEARAVATSDRYAADVRAALERWHRAGINAVPSVIVNGKYLIQGGQTSETFEGALRKIAAET